MYFVKCHYLVADRQPNVTNYIPVLMQIRVHLLAVLTSVSTRACVSTSTRRFLACVQLATLAPAVKRVSHVTRDPKLGRIRFCAKSLS
jgi:hypothetical protein